MSRPNLEKLARATDLDVTTTNNEEFSDLIDSLKNNIRLRRENRNDNIYNITYSHPEALVAQKVVQETLNLFVENTLGESRQDTDTASRFLDTQIADYESRLAAAEQRLADFKRKYSDLLPGQGTYYSNIEGLKESLAGVDLQIRETTQQVKALQEKLTAATTSAVAGANVRTADSETNLQTQYDTRIEALQQQLDALKLDLLTSTLMLLKQRTYLMP